MKYMGSKRTLLRNGLGKTLVQESASSNRFVDLFSGTGRVAWHVAEAVDVPVLAVDLQYYSAVLAAAIIERDKPVDSRVVLERWITKASGRLDDGPSPMSVSNVTLDDPNAVLKARDHCASYVGGPVWNAYGGYYFSPRQAWLFDVLGHTIPDEDRGLTRFCRALLVLAASSCAAAPGHTAQPFAPTWSALPHITDSWKRDPTVVIRNLIPQLARRYAQRKGEAIVADANEVALRLGQGDVAFIDPPYSSVHYSRFYHVLETVARGTCGPVSGVGRYPPRSERPRSAYSIKSEARRAILDLLERLAANGCRVILTFPVGTASNGINGREMVEYARRWYRADEQVVTSRFSTMGGNGYNRRSRQEVGEMIVVMHPRRQAYTMSTAARAPSRSR